MLSARALFTTSALVALSGCVPPAPGEPGADSGRADGARSDVLTHEDVGMQDAANTPEVSVTPSPDAASGVDAAPMDSGVSGAGVAVEFVRDQTGMPSIIAGGVNLLGGTGAYYIIGSCTGADDPGQNVISTGATGGVLRAPGRCPGAPYRLTTTLTSPRSVHVSLQIGPLPVDYRTLSVPLDAKKAFFETLRTSASQHEVGCGLSWSPVAGAESRFDAIPTPCVIPGFGSVGAARFVPQPSWGEISGPLATIRRTFASGDGRELTFYNHPGTNNIELSFNSDFSSVLRAGTVVRLEEDIVVTLPAGGFPTRAAILLPLVYRGVLGREPDASGTATHSPRVQASGAVGMEAVAAAMVASPEFATLRAARTSTELVDQMYRGILGRAGDPAGLAMFVPIAAAGRYTEVVHILISSAEFRAAFPLAF
ncbi:MAG: DUF4214 domain-containing protein [Deltaproteobacteria bacterium]|nr:DUF4214 domain-containing protein [Deltaproteobacteria bacterium]